MTGGIVMSAIASHTPRIGIEAKAPQFLRGVIAGEYALGRAIAALEPDLLVLQSGHWVTTFTWYVTCQARHTGVCVADELPDLIPGVPYDRPGDPDFAQFLAAAIGGKGLLSGRNEAEHYKWDYGTFVPLQYLDPEERLPVVTMGTCILADLDECFEVGRAIREAAEVSGRRIVFVASSALSHRLVRDPASWPLPADQALDREFLDLLRAGRIGEAWRFLPGYAQQTQVEMGGRNIATLLGTLDGIPPPQLAAAQYGEYGPSSGAGHVNFALTVEQHRGQ
jgi:aromatic ring-opening dioxygenase catalytic subunit (LigB family)